MEESGRMKLPDQIDERLKSYIESANGKFVTLAMMYRDHTEPEYDKCVDDLMHYSVQKGFKFSKPRITCTDPERGRYLTVGKHFFGDYLLFIDTDQVFPPDTLCRLVAHDVPIVAALVTAKNPPHLVVAGYGNVKEGFRSLLDWPNNALIEVDVTGFGCVLIKREVFEKFPEGNPFRKIFCEASNDNHGEDWSFCIRAHRLGFSIYVDTSIPIGHIGKYIYTTGDYELYKEHAIANSKGQSFFDECMNPKVVKRLGMHPAKSRMLWTPESEKVIAPKKDLILMGEQ